MRRTRTAWLIAALVSGGSGLCAEEPLFGTDALPKASSESRKIRLSDNHRFWKIPVSPKGINRIIQITGLGPEKGITAALECSPDPPYPLTNQDWIATKGNCDLLFKPNPGEVIDVEGLIVSADHVDSSRITTGTTKRTITKAELHSNPVQVSLVLLKDPQKGDPNLWDKLRPALLLFGITLVVALIGSLFFRQYVRRTQKSGSLPADEFAPEFVAPTPAMARAQPGVQARPMSPRRSSQAEQYQQETALERAQKEHSRLLASLDSRVQSIETRIEQVADGFVSALREHGEEANRRLSDIRNDASRRMRDVESRIREIDERLKGHLEGQSSKLQDLFKDLPTLADLNITAARVLQKSDLSRLEEQLISAAKQAALPSAKLEPVQAESRGFMDAIQAFVPVANKINGDQTRKRLERLVGSMEVLENELANLSQLATAQKYGFFVEMSLLDQNPLANDLAAALQREVTKLSDPDGYYSKRLASLQAQVGVAAVDLTDLDIDSERRQLGLQDALTKLIRALGMTEIDPRKNEKLQASDHQVLQFVRRETGALPGTVAHTMARGVRRGTEVIRKASVLLYD